MCLDMQQSRVKCQRIRQIWHSRCCNKEQSNCNSATVVQQKKRKDFLSVQAVFKALPQLPQKISGTIHYLFRLEFVERHIAAVLSCVANGDGIAALRGFYQIVLGKCFQQSLTSQAETLALLIAEYFHMTISNILVEVEIMLVLESNKIYRIRVLAAW